MKSSLNLANRLPFSSSTVKVHLLSLRILVPLLAILLCASTALSQVSIAPTSLTAPALIPTDNPTFIGSVDVTSDPTGQSTYFSVQPSGYNWLWIEWYNDPYFLVDDETISTPDTLEIEIWPESAGPGNNVVNDGVTQTRTIGTIDIGGNTLTVVQSGKDNTYYCNPNTFVIPATSSGNVGSFTVSSSVSGSPVSCSVKTLVGGSSWLSASGTTTTGGNINIYVNSPNTSAFGQTYSRSAIIQVNNEPIYVDQEGTATRPPWPLNLGKQKRSAQAGGRTY